MQPSINTAANRRKLVAWDHPGDRGEVGLQGYRAGQRNVLLTSRWNRNRIVLAAQFALTGATTRRRIDGVFEASSEPLAEPVISQHRNPNLRYREASSRTEVQLDNRRSHGDWGIDNVAVPAESELSLAMDGGRLV